MAVALRVPRLGERDDQHRLLVQRAGRPGRHHDQPVGQLDRRPPPLVHPGSGPGGGGAGEIVETSFRAEEEGVYEGQSTQFSGTAYPAMRAWVRVVSLDEYEQYVADLGEDLGAAQEAVQEEVATQAAAEGASE